MVEKGGVAAFGVGKLLRFQVVEEFLASDYFIVDEVRDLVWKNALREIEFDEEDDANLTGAFDRLREPVKKGVTSRCCEVEDFAWWTYAL